MSLLNILLKSLLSEKTLKVLIKKTGLSASKLKKLLPLAIPVLLKALTNNASSQSGLQSLLGALTQHTSTRALPEQIEEADATDGSKIVGHIFGDNSRGMLSSLAQQSGLNEQEVGSVLNTIAPSLLSGLSAATASGSKPTFDLSDGLDMGDVMAIFGGTVQQKPSGGLLGGLFGGSGGLLGSLLGQKTDEKDDSLNGTALLSALLSAKR